MRFSRHFGSTLREPPTGAESPSHQLLLRAGFIRQLGQGLFSYLPLAKRSLTRIENVMREEMDRIGGQEMTMPVVHPAEVWKATGRWSVVGPEMARFKDRKERDMVLAMTHEEVVADYRTAGLSLRAHPISFYRRQLDRLGIMPARKLVELTNDAPVCVAGLVLLRQRPSTAKGITFVTLEDETGTINLVVHQRTWDRFYRIARRAPAWIAHGCLENREGVVHLVVSRLEDLAREIGELRTKSRDFH